VGKSKTLGTINGHATSFTAGKTKDYQSRVCDYAHIALDGDVGFLTGLVHVRALYVFDRPQRLLKRSKRTGLLMGADEGRMPFTGKPDLDNLFKSSADGMKWAGVFTDDTQIDNWDGSRRFYAAIGEQAHTEILVEEIEC
jgi:Holliday junction resolvase RusA-like endonuclease